MPAIVRSAGTTPSERYLAMRCEKSFLRLWSYPNLFRDQGQKDGKGDGKELCDLLVVFGHHIILFSDKSCRFPDSGDVLLDWKRWFIRSIKKSSAQVFGAERWIRSFSNRVYLDRACTQKFPLPIPRPNDCRFHRIVIALNASTRCKEFFGHTSNGSLIIRPTTVGRAHLTMPFCIGQVDPTRGYVHVFDDYTFDVVLSELDTITDLVEYLTKKESLITSEKLICAAGEEELLAYYLAHSSSHGEHDFALSTGESSLLLNGRNWNELENDPQYIGKKNADAPSYLWDALLEDAIDLFIAGHAELENQNKARECESVLRFMAGESRFTRRALVASFIELQRMTRVGTESARVTLPSEKSRIGYVFLILPQTPNETNQAYEDRRKAMLVLFGYAAKQDYPLLEHIVGIAIEPTHLTIRIIYQDPSMFPSEAPALAKEVRSFFQDTIRTVRREFKFPKIASVTPSGVTLTVREPFHPNRKMTHADCSMPQPKVAHTFSLPMVDEDVHRKFDANRRQLLKARKIFRDTKDMVSLCFVLERLTWLDRQRSDWSAFRDSMTERLVTARDVKSLKYLAQTVLELARMVAMPVLSNFGGDEYPEIRTFAFDEICKLEKFLEGRSLNECGHEIADVYYHSSLQMFDIEAASALRWARSAVRMYHKFGLEEEEAHALARLGRIHAELGNFRAALRNYKVSLIRFKKIESPVAQELKRAIEVCKLARRAKMRS